LEQAIAQDFAMSGDTHTPLPNSVAVHAWSALSMVRTWCERARFCRELAALTEHELQDMGTCWSSISDEVNKPFWRA
jgi:uncharacterized protein YjiS (DUF1127 family)